MRLKSYKFRFKPVKFNVEKFEIKFSFRLTLFPQGAIFGALWWARKNFLKIKNKRKGKR